MLSDKLQDDGLLGGRLCLKEMWEWQDEEIADLLESDAQPPKNGEG